MDWLQWLTTDPLGNLVALVIGLVLGLTVLRFLLRLTARIFALGCAGILILGVVWAGLQYLR